MKDPALEDAHGEPRTALIFGGTSEIALAIARKLIDGRLRQVVLAVRGSPCALSLIHISEPQRPY